MLIIKHNSTTIIYFSTLEVKLLNLLIFKIAYLIY